MEDLVQFLRARILGEDLPQAQQALEAAQESGELERDWSVIGVIHRAEKHAEFVEELTQAAREGRVVEGSYWLGAAQKLARQYSDHPDCREEWRP